MPNERHYFMPLVVKDWMGDPQVSLLAEPTRGIWIDALCSMFMLDRCGQLQGTVQDLARLCRTTGNCMRAAIDDLNSRNAADVSEKDGIVTLTNRRMRREYLTRVTAAERKRKQRGRDNVTGLVDGDVTGVVTPDVTPRIHSHNQNKTQKRIAQAAPACPPASPRDRGYSPGFLRVWADSPALARDRSSRKQAFAVWQRQRLEPFTDAVVAALRAWGESDHWRGGYVPGLHRWLANQKWKEQPASNGANHGNHRSPNDRTIREGLKL